MQIVIEIPENFYNGVKVVTEESEDITEEVVTLPMECIANGIPLPKGHGRLIDADALKKAYKSGNWDLHKVLDGAETIIEAESEDKE